MRVCYDWSRGSAHHDPSTAKSHVYIHAVQVVMLIVFTVFRMWVSYPLFTCWMVCTSGPLRDAQISFDFIFQFSEWQFCANFIHKWIVPLTVVLGQDDLLK